MGESEQTPSERRLPLAVSSLNRKAIADGVVMENERLDAAQARGWLRHVANSLGLKLSRVARLVIKAARSGPRRDRR